MSIRDELFAGLTEEEQHFLEERWQSGRQGEFPGFADQDARHFYLLIRLLNNELGFLSKAEGEPGGLYYFLQNTFPPVEDSEELTESKFPLINARYNLVLNNLKRNTSRELESDSAKLPETDPKLLYLRIKLNLINALKENGQDRWQSILGDRKILEELLALNFNATINFCTFAIEYDVSLINPLPTNKPWLDLRGEGDYFQQEKDAYLIEKIRALKCLTEENKNNLIEALSSRMKRALPFENPSCMELSNLINAYHDIPKSDIKNITKRRKLLIKISNLAQRLLTEPDLTPAQIGTVAEISHQSQMKANYLRELQYIPDKAAKRMFRFEHLRGSPLIVDKADWFGDLDPVHRDANQKLSEIIVIEVWEGLAEQAFNEGRDFPNLWMWLESRPEGDVSAMSFDKRYSVPRSQKLVTIQEGICYNPKCSNREDGRIEDGIYLYNIGKDNNLYILPCPSTLQIGKDPSFYGKGVKDGQNYNHNSILHGESVQCAGCIIFKEGKIHHIDTNSGHYRPYMSNLHDIVQTILYPAQAFTEEAVVTNYEEAHYVPVQSFVDEHFDIKAVFPHSLPTKIELTPEQVEKAYGFHIDRMHDVVERRRRETSQGEKKSKVSKALLTYARRDKSGDKPSVAGESVVVGPSRKKKKSS